MLNRLKFLIALFELIGRLQAFIDALFESLFLFGSLALQTLCYALLTVISLVGMLEIYTFRISLCFPKLASEKVSFL